MTISGTGLAVTSLALFGVAQLIHIMTWKISRPSEYLYWFLKFWVIVPVTLAVVVLLVARFIFGYEITQQIVFFWVAAFVGYGALCGAYVLIYPAIYTLSPSLEILRYLRGTPHGTAKSEQLPYSSETTSLVTDRVETMLDTGFVERDNGDLVLTGRGRKIGRIVDFYRRFLGLDQSTGG